MGASWNQAGGSAVETAGKDDGTVWRTCVFAANVGTNKTSDESTIASKDRPIVNLFFIEILP